MLNKCLRITLKLESFDISMAMKNSFLLFNLIKKLIFID